MMNGLVSSTVPESNNSYFATSDTEGRQYLSMKIILATGMKDLLPDTPGLATGWGKKSIVRNIYTMANLHTFRYR